MSKKSVLLVLSLVLLVFGGLFTIQYLQLSKEQIKPGEIIQFNSKESKNTKQDSQEQGSLSSVKHKIEVVAENLFVPWSIVFTSSDRILVTERSGYIKEIVNGVLNPEPLHNFPEVSTRAEEGLMGLAVDPNYKENNRLYACVAYEQGNALAVKVVRLIDRGSIIDRDGIVLDNIPAARYHAGCRLAFGPDEKLYITTGDATNKQIAQDLNSLGGKILRINTDGSVPADNPFENSYVYSYGHRNAQGIDWHPESGVLLSTEHGPSVFDGPAGGDEVNRIVAGGNYGWPIVSHDENKSGLIAPVIQFTPATAPASALVYSGNIFPQWKGDLLYGGLRGQGIYRVSFTDINATEVSEVERLSYNVGRVRDVVEGPDGYIYFSTSNEDGRGDAQTNDDKIYRIIPAE